MIFGVWWSLFFLNLGFFKFTSIFPKFYNFHEFNFDFLKFFFMLICVYDSCVSLLQVRRFFGDIGYKGKKNSPLGERKFFRRLLNIHTSSSIYFKIVLSVRSFVSSSVIFRTPTSRQVLEKIFWGCDKKNSKITYVRFFFYSSGSWTSEIELKLLLTPNTF